jgi:hypothetical protein
MSMKIYDVPFDYAPGQQVLKKVHDLTKLGVKTEGPYTIECVHTNCNLTILLCEGNTRLSASTYAEFCHIDDHSTYPCEDNSKHGLYLSFSLFTSDLFSPPHI